MSLRMDLMDVSVSFVKVYWNAKLVFAGGKFNGYGVTLKDFAREVCVCVQVCMQCMSR